MSQRSLRGADGLHLARPLGARDPDEADRASTPLELFYDLVFVVAVASASERLHHAYEDGLDAAAIVSFCLVFFAIWWAWMNFTWFASAYDGDDVFYRASVFVMMTGALILAAGVPRAFDERDFTVVAIGYVVIRLALVTQWIRVARADVDRRGTARRFAIGVSVAQVGWVLALFLPEVAWIPAFLVLATTEALVPIWAESAAPTRWHPRHIVERYGLFTIIVLGESILAASAAIRSATDAGTHLPELARVTGGGLLVVFSMWWLYFDRPFDEPRLAASRTTFVWSYGHLPLYASIAAVGAGLAAAIERATGHGEISTAAAGATVAVPVVVFLAAMWALHAFVEGHDGRASGLRIGIPAAIVGVALAPLTPAPVLATGIVLAVLVAVKIRVRIRERPPA